MILKALTEQLKARERKLNNNSRGIISFPVSGCFVTVLVIYIYIKGVLNKILTNTITGS